MSTALSLMQFDVTGLRRTSDVEGDSIPWRARDVTLVWIRRNGKISQAQRIEEKRRALNSAAADDCLLLAWPGSWSQDIFHVDDRPAALLGLEPRRANSS